MLRLRTFTISSQLWIFFILVGFGFLLKISGTLYASHGLEIEKSLQMNAYPIYSQFKLIDRIEFGFVLLPDKETSYLIIQLSRSANNHVRGLEDHDYKDIYQGDYVNIPVRIPHVSVGQYGSLAAELPKLFKIVDDIAERYEPLTCPMAFPLSVGKDNISLNFRDIHAKTDPKIIELYLQVRDQYMTNIVTKMPMAQAQLSLLRYPLNSLDAQLIRDHFQNWGTPEDNRICPHFTLAYKTAFPQKETQELVGHLATPPELLNIKFSHIGIVKIDCWGNPEADGLLYRSSLKTK